VSKNHFTKHSKTLSFYIYFRQVLAILHIILHPGIEILNPPVLYRQWSYFKPPGTVRMVTIFQFACNNSDLENAMLAHMKPAVMWHCPVKVPSTYSTVQMFMNGSVQNLKLTWSCIINTTLSTLCNQFQWTWMRPHGWPVVAHISLISSSSAFHYSIIFTSNHLMYFTLPKCLSY
jgi:hypothetical protein